MGGREGDIPRGERVGVGDLRRLYEEVAELVGRREVVEVWFERSRLSFRGTSSIVRGRWRGEGGAEATASYAGAASPGRIGGTEVPALSFEEILESTFVEWEEEPREG